MQDIPPYTQLYGPEDEWPRPAHIGSLPDQSNGAHTKHEKASLPQYGPLPPAEYLAAYNDAFPDGAKHVFMMAHEQMRHRQERERRTTEANIRRAYYGLAAGFIVAFVGLTYAFFLGMAGHEGTAQWIGVADLVSLVSLFLAGQGTRDRSLVDRVSAIVGTLRGEKHPT